MKKIFKLFTKELTEDEKILQEQRKAAAKEAAETKRWMDSLKKKP